MSLREVPDAKVNVPLTEIVVRAEDLEYPDLDGHGVTGDVFEFVYRMLWDTHYPRHAIPREAVLCAAVHYFLQTFDGDGLGPFIESTGWDPAVRDDIREGLKHFGFDEIGAIFADFEAFVAGTDPEWYETDDWSDDPALMALEERLTEELPFEDLYDLMAERIKSWPYLRGVPAAQYQSVLKALSEKNRTATD